MSDWRRRRRPRRPMFVRFLVCFGSLSSIACANIRALESRVRKSDMWENRFESAIRILLCLRVATVVPSHVMSPLSCVYVHSNFPSPHLPFSPSYSAATERATREIRSPFLGGLVYFCRSVRENEWLMARGHDSSGYGLAWRSWEKS